MYAYDSRHRLASVVQRAGAVSPGTDACAGQVTTTGSSSYAYDEGDNRVSVTESSTGGTAATRTYCHDGLDRLTAVRAGAPCSSSPDEAYVYDGAGNRTSATSGGATWTFSYGADGPIAGYSGGTCTPGPCAVSRDEAGRVLTVSNPAGDWTYAYDADGRMTSACKGATCVGTGFDRVDWLYDGEGRRTRITETDAGQNPARVTVADLRYRGDSVVQESVSVNGGASVVARTYALDDAGRIVEVCDPDCGSGTVYVVAWSGHGDATGLWRVNSDGSLTLANSYTYATWGTPATTVAAGFADLKFRYLWVGASDVQWDGAFGLGLYCMHARSYSPSLGRFLQPDPARADGNLYAYAGNSPVTKSDPSGLDSWWRDYRVVYRTSYEITWWEDQLGQAAFNYLCGYVRWRSKSPWQGGRNALGCWGLTTVVRTPHQSDRVVNSVIVYGNDVIDRWDYFRLVANGSYVWVGTYSRRWSGSAQCQRWATGGRYLGLAPLPLDGPLGRCGMYPGVLF